MNATNGTAPAFVPQQPVQTLDVPIDESNERSLAFAAWLAGVWNLPVRLLHVSESAGSDRAFLDEAMAEAASMWPDLSFGAEHLDGSPTTADAADAVAGAIGAVSLAVVASDHANAWSFKHSVAEAVVERIGTPLVLVGPRAEQPNVSGDVVAAVSGSAASDSAVAAAAVLAAALGRTLWLVRVLPDPGFGRPDAASTEPSADPAAQVDEVAQVDKVDEAERRLVRQVEELDPAIQPRHRIVHSNDPVGAIEAFADQVGASFIVAGSRRRTDQSRTTMSSITMGLVAAAARPVLVVNGGSAGPTTTSRLS